MWRTQHAVCTAFPFVINYYFCHWTNETESWKMIRNGSFVGRRENRFQCAQHSAHKICFKASSHIQRHDIDNRIHKNYTYIFYCRISIYCGDFPFTIESNATRRITTNSKCSTRCMQNIMRQPNVRFISPEMFYFLFCVESKACAVPSNRCGYTATECQLREKYT